MHPATANMLRWCARGVVVAAAMLAGCAAEAPRADAIAIDARMVRRIVAGDGFRHVVYEAGGSAAGPMWIYLEGDGMPWLTDGVPARDPTPASLVALEMMARGPRPAFYLGRPCYFEVNRDSGCAPHVWTHARFGSAVVRSLETAIGRLRDESSSPDRPIVLVGFSGGGTLAALLAARLPRVCALVTMASPLDIDEWAAQHDYSRLAESRNPAAEPALPSQIRQLHYRGRDDAIVAATNGADYFRRNRGSVLQVLDTPRHGREWVEVWSDVLRQQQATSFASCEVR